METVVLGEEFKSCGSSKILEHVKNKQEGTPAVLWKCSEEVEENDSCSIICEVTTASDEPKDSFVGKTHAKTEPRWPIYTSAGSSQRFFLW